MLYDQIALEKHDYTAMKAERIQNAKHWVISINADAQIMPQQKRGCQRLQDEYMAETSSSTHQLIRANKCVKIQINNLKDVKIMITLLIGKQDGHGTKDSRETCRIFRLRRPHHGRIPHGNIGIHGGGILQSLTKGSE